MNSTFSPWPSFTIEEAEAVKETLLSNRVNYWTGSECKSFEQEFAEFVGTGYAIALANGTVALDLALKALNIKPGDEVVVTSRTFLASVSSIINAGAIPIFADVSLKTQNITATSIKKVLTVNTKAIICVHLAGWPCDMEPIIKLACEHNLYIIEDCAQAHGARYKGKSVGSLGNIGCWSFCQDKIMTTGGEGGMVTTNDKELWAKMWSYKDHGKNFEKIQNKKNSVGFQWVHESFGTNWRMTEMQAVIGRIQLKRMPEWTSKRRANAQSIMDAASKLPGVCVPSLYCESCFGGCNVQTGCLHAAYKCYVFIEAGENARNAIMAKINAKGVPCFQGSCSEVYLEKAFDGSGFRPNKRLPNAKKLYETSLMFLCHPTLTEKEISLTCDAITTSFNEVVLWG